MIPPVEMTVPGWTSVIVMVTFLGAVQLVSIGIVGEYLARVYDQSRGVPRYVVVERNEAAGSRHCSADGTPH
jgi:hypothetical protein